jgi:hypothetical protein
MSRLPDTFRGAQRLRRAAAAALLALAFAATTAHAGRSCEAQIPEAANVVQALQLAERTANILDASGAQVVVLARAGQDLRKYGLRWSHLGFAYREAAGEPAADGKPTPGVWRVVHKLNTCGAATADVYRQGLGEFFMDDLFRYEGAYAVPTPALQAALLPLLREDWRVTQLHQRAYSMVAYPWAQTYQQSNQWAIETLAMAQEPGITSRERAQAWLQFKGYEPTTLRLGALTRLGARMTAANVAFDDHPNEKRFSDRIETVTVDSVFDWLQRSGLAGRVQVLR